MAEKDAELDDELEENLEVDVDDPGDEDDLPDTDEDPDKSDSDDEDPDSSDPDGKGSRSAKKPEPRGNRQFGVLRKENRELRDQVQRFGGQLDQISRTNFQGQTEAQRLAEEQRLTEMSEDERREHYRQKDRNEIAGAIAQTKFQSDDRMDRLEFRQACQGNKLLASVADEVETELQRMRSNNRNADRNVIAAKILGDRVIAKAGKTTAKKEKNVRREEHRRQAGRASQGGSDVAAERGGAKDRKGKTAAERLDGIKF